MFRALLRFVDQFLTDDGAWWILALDGILLIPLLFAMFFYPLAALLLLAAAAAVTVGVAVLVRAVRTYQHTHP